MSSVVRPTISCELYLCLFFLLNFETQHRGFEKSEALICSTLHEEYCSVESLNFRKLLLRTNNRFTLLYFRNTEGQVLISSNSNRIWPNLDRISAYYANCARGVLESRARTILERS